MATNKWCIILLQLIIFVFHKTNSQTLSTVPCQPVLKDYFDYLTAPHSGYHRDLYIQATSILQNRYVAYYTGILNYVPSIDSLKGTVTVSFSDRTWVPPPCNSFFCPEQNFNYKKTDTQTIVIHRSGSIQRFLNGSSTLNFIDQLQCYGINQPFYTAPKSFSPFMFVMTLQKDEVVVVT